MALFGPSENEKRLYATIESVIGPTVEESHAPSSGKHWLRGTYHDNPITVGVGHHEGGLSGYTVRVDLGGRPINLTINWRERTTIHGRPEVRTGDERFDAMFLLNGWPAEVIQAGLTPEIREYLLARYARTWPPIELDDDVGEGSSLRWYTPAEDDGPFVTREDLCTVIDRTIDLAGRLAAAFDARQAELVAEGGEAAAAAWIQQSMATRQASAESRTRFRMILLGGLIAFVVLTLVGSLGVVLLVFLAAR